MFIKETSSFPSHLQPLRLPSHMVLYVLSGEIEQRNGNYEAIERGALWGVEDQKKYEGIIHHSVLVRRVAMGLADLLNIHHQDDHNWNVLDTKLIGNAALLEDFGKRYELQTKNTTSYIDHVQAGLKILKEVDLPQKEKIERILQVHLYGMNGYKEEPMDWTEKILVLADYYCTSEIVNQEEREKDFIKRQQKGLTMPTSPEEHAKGLLLDLGIKMI